VLAGNFKKSGTALHPVDDHLLLKHMVHNVQPLANKQLVVTQLNIIQQAFQLLPENRYSCQ